MVRGKVVNTNIIFFGFTRLGLEAYTTLNAGTGIKQLKQHDIRVVLGYVRVVSGYVRVVSGYVRVVSGYVCHSTIKAT